MLFSIWADEDDPDLKPKMSKFEIYITAAEVLDVERSTHSDVAGCEPYQDGLLGMPEHTRNPR